MVAVLAHTVSIVGLSRMRALGDNFAVVLPQRLNGFFRRLFEIFLIGFRFRAGLLWHVKVHVEDLTSLDGTYFYLVILLKIDHGCLILGLRKVHREIRWGLDGLYLHNLYK